MTGAKEGAASQDSDGSPVVHNLSTTMDKTTTGTPGTLKPRRTILLLRHSVSTSCVTRVRELLALWRLLLLNNLVIVTR